MCVGTVVVPDLHGDQPGVTSTRDVLLRMIADVRDALGRRVESSHERVEGSLVGLGCRQRAGDDRRVEQLSPSETVEFAALCATGPSVSSPTR